MLKRNVTAPPEHLFPPDAWRIVEARYSERYLRRAETAFALCNGYVGVRGTFEEGRPAGRPAPSSTASTRPGRSCTPRPPTGWPRTGQTIVNVPDATILAPLRRRRAALPAHRPACRLPAGARHAQRHADARPRVGDRGPASTSGCARAGWSRCEHRHLVAMQLRGDATDQVGAGRHLVAAAQPAGRSSAGRLRAPCRRGPAAAPRASATGCSTPGRASRTGSGCCSATGRRTAA